MTRRPLILVASCWLSGVLALLLTGCGREQVKTYRIPKEKIAADSADPHGTAAAAHGDMTALPRIEYKAPAGWEEMPPGSMRAAHFSVTGKNGQKADISAIPLPGATAPVLDIVNMWREQVKLKPASESDLAKFTEKVAIGSAQGQLYEITSTEPIVDNAHKARILAAIMKRDETIWVFKMYGEAEAVLEQKPSFQLFLKSVRFSEPSQAAPQVAGAPMGATPTATTPGGPPKKPTWDAPANWQEQPPSQMLLAKFVVSGSEKAQTEVTVSAFPGDVGGLLANVNRWRGQVGLSPIEEAELAKQISSFDVLGGKATLVEISGTSPRSGQKTRLVGAIVQRGDQTWFYKMMGDEQLTAREKETFIKFVQSVRYPNAG